MKIKYGILVSDPVQNWLLKVKKLELSPKYAVRVKQMITKINNATKSYNEVKQELLKKYGKTNEDGTITVHQNIVGWDEFKDKWEELINTEVEIEEQIIFTSEELEELNDIQLSGEDIEYLDTLKSIKW